MEQQWTQVTTWEILVRYEVIVVVFTFYLLLWLFFKLLLFLFIYFAGGSNTGPDCPEKLFHSVILSLPGTSDIVFFRTLFPHLEHM